MDRVNRLTQNAVRDLLDRAASYMQNRKTTAQPIGTHNMRYSLTSAGEPAWSGTLPPSPSAPTNGLKILRLTVTARRQGDLFGRIISRLDVGSDGSWYRFSDYLAAIKAGGIGYRVIVFPATEFGFTRNTKTYYVTIDGANGGQVFLRLWMAANDEVTASITEVN